MVSNQNTQQIFDDMSSVDDIAKRIGVRYSELISKDDTQIHNIQLSSYTTTNELTNELVRERRPPQKPKKMSSNVRKYYNDQKTLIHSFMEAEECVKFNENSPSIINSNTRGITDFVDKISNDNISKLNLNINKHIRIIKNMSFLVNICLFISKIIAAYYSNSISIISSTVDSGIDIFASAVAFFSDKSMNKINFYKHPQGKYRLEPIGILIISCVMSFASFQIITESIKRMVTKVDLIPTLSYISIGIILATILIKLALTTYCYHIRTPSVDALKQDHQNDVISNIFALIGFVLSKYVWCYMDSLFALIINIYISFNWVRTAKENVKCLIGRSASPQDIQRLTWICMHHHKDIVAIDTVRAYTFGIRYLVEVDLVLPETMLLKIAHDIGESLQQKLESLPEVERAFVHLDYEYTHKPEIEHRVVRID